MPLPKPPWLKQEIPSFGTDRLLGSLLSEKINTVCQEAHCPNLNRCFRKNELTFMILGDTCSRNCVFCAVKKSPHKNLPLDKDEPRKISKIVKALRLSYVVITSVTRDDLPDYGAGHFALTIDEIRRENGNIKIEVLIPDFRACALSLKALIAARPDVLAHNLETVKSLSLTLRPLSDYNLSLEVLKLIKKINSDMITKSSLMLGIGEEEDEIIKTFEDLRKVKCDILVLGQYLAPTPKHYPVKEFIVPGQFKRYGEIALGMGFKAVLSEPLARSSYKAEELYSCMTQ